MHSTSGGAPISCTVRTCPRGCPVVTIGTVSLHLSSEDFGNLVKLLVNHAEARGIDVTTDSSATPLVVYH